MLCVGIGLAGCANLQQNIQHGNPTKQVTDNRWDYYNGTPVHYTSFNRGLYKNALIVRQEPTDMFSTSLNLDKNSGVAVAEFNGKILSLNQLNDMLKIDRLIEKTFGVNADKKLYKHWDRWYESDDGKFLVAVNYSKQIVATSFDNGDTIQQIAYYPSRYLACKKIASIKKEVDSRVIKELLRTALVAGVQSYTSYTTTNLYSNYGNFGYAVTRDYSWAGARAGDALDTLFSGQYSDEKVSQAWNSLNCW